MKESKSPNVWHIQLAIKNVGLVLMSQRMHMLVEELVLDITS